MAKKPISLLRIVILFPIVVVLVAILVPFAISTHCGKGRLHCLHNLQQLYKLGTVCAANHKGQWPEVESGNYWVSFTKTTPLLIDPDHFEILACPIRGEELGPGEADYRGPRVPWKQLKPSDPVAADKPGNHGIGEKIYVVLKDGTALEIGPEDPLWKRCEEVLGP